MDAVRKKSFIIARKADGMEMGKIEDEGIGYNGG